MKVLLVNPLTKYNAWAAPDLRFAYLSSSLKSSGHLTSLLDCVNNGYSFGKFEEFIKEKDFDVVGFKVFSTDIPSVKKSISIVRKNRPDAVIVIGGHHSSAFPEQSLQYFDEADYAFRGEAECGLKDLVNNLSNLHERILEKVPGLIWRKPGKIICNPPVFVEDLDSLDPPDWELIEPDRYFFQTSYFTKSKIVAPLFMTRGCAYGCTFCSSRSVTGRRTRSHSATY
ncbi:MAG TPA: cobalamin-dependent protein, partial [Candidatus Omnitrophota bacterium]|nr:cobalamin-dependent protein [Candidatus Omnitrophota bacterium]